MKLPIYFKQTLAVLTKKVSLFSLVFVGILFFSCGQKEAEYIAIVAPVEFSPEIPVDVDPKLQEKLIKQKDIFALNEAYNRYSWQAFMAINWPVAKDGKAKAKFTDKGDPSWLGWKEAFQVYRADGQKPAPWGAPRTESGLKINEKILSNNDARILLSSKTPTHPDNFNIDDETDQAFAGELFDQNGNVIVYEVLMNKIEFDYVVENELYNLNGQINFASTGAIADFPAGDYDNNYLGAVEIKFAWKILKDTDKKERYFQNEAYVYNKDSVLVKKHFGLIGMHISQKTPTGKQWVWSTFEHIDNLDQNVIIEKDGSTTVIHPTLTDPNCEICPVNVDATNRNSKGIANTYTHNSSKHSDYWNITNDSNNYYANSTVMKTQAKRMIDIPVRVKLINSMMQDYFKELGSVWQYYQLIDTQYPVDQNIVPGISTITEYHLPESVINKSGGKPNVALLTNITMETFFQDGNQVAGLMENSTTAKTDKPITIFGTESCIGCHSSAKIAKGYDAKFDSIILGNQLSGDFSWLLKKAAWEKGVPKSTTKTN
tara:strand:+ start:560 stop:2191 length:1632 start_codon:yes stop_codon:yes gene_type:complete